MEEFPNPFGLTPSLIRSFGYGFIAWWYGALNNIPVGWALCNGENGTPDLRDKFLLGPGIIPVDGSATQTPHTHNLTSDAHSHELNVPGGGLSFGTDFDNSTSSDVITATTDPANPLPPYHALAYIMEL